MTKIILTIFIALALIDAGCKKKEPQTMAVMNMSGTSVTFERCPIDQLSGDTVNIHLQDFRENNAARLSFVLANCKLITGKQRLVTRDFNSPTAFQSVLYTEDDDILADIYNTYMPDSANNYLELTHIDRNQGILIGKFQCSYIRDTSRAKYYPDIPDTLKVTEGYFDIRQKW